MPKLKYMPLYISPICTHMNNPSAVDNSRILTHRVPLNLFPHSCCIHVRPRCSSSWMSARIFPESLHRFLTRCILITSSPYTFLQLTMNFKWGAGEHFLHKIRITVRNSSLVSNHLLRCLCTSTYPTDNC
jgi:hypothetical protein